MKNKKNLIFSLSLVFIFLNCSSKPLDKYELHYIKIIVFIDKTASITQAGVPHIHPSEFQPLLNLLSSKGGEIIITEISPNSVITYDNCKYNFETTEIPPKIIGKSYQNYYKDVVKLIGDPEKNKENNKKVEAHLKENIKHICDYTNLYNATDILGALKFGIRYINEPFNKQDYKLTKAIIFISDGDDTVNMYSIPDMTKLKKEEIYIINKSTSSSIFNQIDHQPFSDFTNAINYFINEYGN